MRTPIDDEVRKTMHENFFKMKRVKIGQNALQIMSIAMFFFQLIFFVVGALNIFCLIGMVINIAVFLIGTYLYHKSFVHYIMIILNMLLAILYLIIRPESLLLIRIGIVQHLYLALEMYCFNKIGSERYDLSFELGYPYFNELAAYMQEEKEYVSENDVSTNLGDMEDIHEEEVSYESVQLRPEYSSYEKENLHMDELDISQIEMNFKRDAPVIEKENLYSEQYKNLQPVQEELQYDKELLRKNRLKMKNFKREQGVIFLVDIVLLLFSAENVLDWLINFSERPLNFLHVYAVIGVLVASLITVTCLENKQVLEMSVYAYGVTGLFFSLIIMDPSFTGVFVACIIQIIYTRRLAKCNDFLKTQFGYPYFSESVLKKQYNQKEYIPEHRINFENTHMDEL